jgi:thiol-disulfide isomerase/thioredoxin
MTRLILNAVLATLLASSWSVTHAETIELATTSQFTVQGSSTFRSVELPAAFLVQPSPFGRPVLITTGPLGARLIDPARISHDATDPDVIRIDTGGWQENFLSVRPDGSGLIVDRDGLTMTLKESPPLLGDRTLDELVGSLPEYRRNAARYTPDPAALEQLRRMKQPTELLIFFGSWCPHCEQAVPRLVRVLEDVQGAPIAATFHGVPHDDSGRDSMTEDLRITGLPTLIVRRDGHEVARMEGEQWVAPEKSLATLLAKPARR